MQIFFSCQSLLSTYPSQRRQRLICSAGWLTQWISASFCPWPPKFLHNGSTNRAGGGGGGSGWLFIGLPTHTSSHQTWCRFCCCLSSALVSSREQWGRPASHMVASWLHQTFPTWKVKVLVAQSCPTLHGDRQPPLSMGFSRQEYWRILVAVSFSKGFSLRTRVSCIAGRFFTVWATKNIQTWDTWILISYFPPEGGSNSFSFFFSFCLILYINSNFILGGLQNHCRWWLQPWN